MSVEANTLDDTQPVPVLCVVVIVPNYWGKGSTAREAWKRVVRESGVSKRDWISQGYYRVMVMPQTEANPAYVDDYGRLHWADVDGMRALTIESSNGPKEKK